MTSVIDSTSGTSVSTSFRAEQVESMGTLEQPIILKSAELPANRVVDVEASVTSLGSLGDHSFRLVEPVPIEINRDGENFVVVWSGTDEFGYGPSVVEAIRDFQLTLIELFETLTSSREDELSSDLRTLKNQLRKIIRVTA